MDSEYHHSSNYYYYSSSGSSSDEPNSHHLQPQPIPLHLCFFLAIILLFLTFSRYFSYESTVDGLFDQLKIGLMLLPLLSLLALHCLSGIDHSWVSFLMPIPEEVEMFRGSGGSGGSPWGVACVLLLLIIMVAYRSAFRESWFPLISR